MKTLKVPETYNDVVGLYLVELRTARGATQAVVGRTLGITQSAFARLESGATAMTIIQARKLARYFRMKTPAFVQEIEDRARMIPLKRKHCGVCFGPMTGDHPNACIKCAQGPEDPSDDNNDHPPLRYDQ